jgi:hypothetical protein
MTTHRLFLVGGLTLATLVCGASGASAVTFTCSSVNRQAFFDPDSERLTNRFESPSVNSSGDVVFVGRTRGGAHKLYLHPNGGAASVVAAEDSAAPGGNTFDNFADASINDDADIGFLGDLATGNGVFVRPNGGSLVSAARSGQASPAGGTFATFSDVSAVNADGDIAFIAQVTGGPSGVFVYDVSADSIGTIATVGEATGGGKTFCSFVNVALGGGRTAFQAVTETTCGVSNDPTSGIFQRQIIGFTLVAAEGGAAPIAGTTYARFFELDSNSDDDVGFRAKVGGTAPGTAIFLFDPSGPTTTTLIHSGDTAPVSGGLIKTVGPIGGISDTDAVGFRGKVTHGSAKQGVFIFDGTDEAAVLNTSTVPNDLWGTTAIYKNIDEDIGVSRSGGWVTFSAKVKDQQTPSGTGLFRCHGV